MSDMNPSRPGQSEGTGSAFAQFLTQFAGEVLVQFDEVNQVLPTVTQRTISNGRSAQFPIIGTTTAAYHTPGTELLGTPIKHNQVTLTVDMPLIANVFVANIDEAMNHYDVRAPYARQLGNALANTLDKHLLQTAVLAARSPARISTDFGGSIITNAAMATDASKVVDALFASAAALDEKSVPGTGRIAWLRPSMYYKIVALKDTINSLYGGAGSYSDGKVFRVAGIELRSSTHVPNAVVATGTLAAGYDDKYAGDFSKTVGVITTQDTVGVLKLMDIQMEHEYSVRHQGTLLVAKYAMGHGVLNPATAIELANT